jgi:hypothetical protein
MCIGRRLPKLVSMTQVFSERARSPLLRCVNGVESPAAGLWTAPRNHTAIKFFVPRLRLRRSGGFTGRATEAVISVADDPDAVLVAVVFQAPDLDLSDSASGAVGSSMHLEARSVARSDRWAMIGEVFTDEVVRPLKASLGYHGLWKRGDRHYGWFVLTGSIEPSSSGRWRRIPFSVEVLAHGPSGERSCPTRPHAPLLATR